MIEFIVIYLILRWIFSDFGINNLYFFYILNLVNVDLVIINIVIIINLNNCFILIYYLRFEVYFGIK